MPLTLVLGRPNAGKSGVLYDVVRSSASEGGSPVVLFPSAAEARVAEQEFLRTGPALGVRVSPFDAFIDELWRAHGDGRGLVGPQERLVLVRGAVRDAHKHGVALPSSGRGVDRLLAAAITHSGSETQLNAGTSGLAGAIGAVLRQYEALAQAASLIERNQAMAQLNELMSPPWFDGPVVVNRFADLSLAQERFLVSLAKAAEVYVALPWQAGFRATRALDATVERLGAGAGRVIECEPRTYTHSDELAHLESHLFLGEAPTAATMPSGDVRLSCAEGEEAEAQRVAAEVNEAVLEGVPPECIAVVFQRVAEHADALSAAMGRLGIGVLIDGPRPARETGWGRSLAHLRDFGRSGSWRDLSAFLKTPYSGMDRNRADDLETVMLRKRPQGCRETLMLLRASQAAGHRLVSAAIASLQGTAQGGSNVGWPETWKNLADTMLRNAYGTTAPSLDEEGLLDAAACTAFLRLVASVAGREVALSVDGDDVVDVFLEGDVGIRRERQAGCVSVLPAWRARSSRFDVVVIGGLTVGDLPRSDEEASLDTPEVASALKRLGIEIDRKDEQDAARLMFYLVASRATKRLVLSRQTVSSGGAELAPSWLLEEVLDVYRPPGAEDVDPETLPPLSFLGFDGRSRTSEAASSQSAPQEGGSAAGGSEPGDRGPNREPVRREGALSPSASASTLEDERALADLAAREVFSATEIESYLRCPYGWFHDRVVRARPLEEGPDASSRGRLCHDVLRRVYTELAPDGLGDRSRKSVARGIDLAEGAIAEIKETTRAEAPLDEIAAIASVRKIVLGFIRADAAFMPGFRPIALEREFGPAEVSFDGFALRGRIDRIDVGPDGDLIVIDYKTGQVGSGHSATKFERDGRVQLALYAKIVRDLLDAPVAAALYRKVSAQNVRSKLNRGFYLEGSTSGPGLVSTDAMSAEDIERVIAGAEQLASEAVQGIRAGRIPSAPRDPRTCEKCRLSALCADRGHR